MSERDISIVVPIYNTGIYLEQCLRSILSQDVDLEVICVDDGSTDNSQEVLENLSDDRRVTIISQENRGLAEARNVGLSKASGRYVAFVDSDDWIDKRMYSVMLAKAQQFDAEVVMCMIQQRSSEGFRLAKKCSYEKSIPAKLDNDAFSWKDIEFTLFNMVPVCWNKIYKRDFLSREQFVFKAAFEGVVFHLSSLLTAKRMAFVRRPLYNWRRDRIGAITRTLGDRPLGLFEAMRRISLVVKHLNSQTITERFEAYKIRLAVEQITMCDADNMHAYFNNFNTEADLTLVYSNKYVRPKDLLKARRILGSNFAEYISWQLHTQIEEFERDGGAQSLTSTAQPIRITSQFQRLLSFFSSRKRVVSPAKQHRRERLIRELEKVAVDAC